MDDGFRADKITLGKEPSGKPITSLALVLESEAKGGEDSPAAKKRDTYQSYDATAMDLLNRLQDPFIKRGDLATAVLGEMAPEQRENDPNAFKKALHNYRVHLTRLSPGSALWRFIGDKNSKGEALTFRNPNNRGHRERKPSRRGPNFAPLKQSEDD